MAVAALTACGCAATRTPVAIRPVDDAVPTSGATRLYMLPDSAVAVGVHAWARLGGDRLILYRPVEELGPNHYRRHVMRLGAAGLAIAGYTLADGKHVDFEGSVRAEGDRLQFRRSDVRRLEKVEGPRELSRAAAEVRSVDAWLPSVGRTTAMIVAIVVIAATGVGLSVASGLQDSAM